MAFQKRVTLKDIAQQAGVHPTTVSLALRNSAELPAETRHRLQELAGQLGYRPDPALSALSACRHSSAGNHRYSIAFVTSLEDPEKWRKNPICTACHEGIARRAAQLGYSLEDFWYDPATMTPKRATQILRTRNIRGLLLSGARLLEHCPEVEWEHFALVSLTQAFTEIPVHVVTNDHFHTCRLAFASLGTLGYQRIGLAMQRTSDEHVQRVWSTVFRGEQSILPASRRVPLHLPPVLEKTGLLDWYHRTRPDAILTVGPHDDAILPWLRQEGLRIPEDVGVATLDRQGTGIPVSGVYQNPEVLGMTSVDTVAGLIQRNDLGWPDHPTEILTRGSWVDALTTCRQGPGTAAQSSLRNGTRGRPAPL